MRLKPNGFWTGVALAALAVGLFHLLPYSGPISQPAAQAQNLGQRLITGLVMDGNDTPVAGVTVFLKNLKTKSIRSYTSDEKGHFRFALVNMAEDYDLWAEKDTRKSAVKSISHWDSRKELDAELKLK